MLLDKETDIYNKKDFRINLTIDAFLGSISQFSQKEVSAKPTLDVFSLLDQKPKIFAFHDKNDLRNPIYHTFQNEADSIKFLSYLHNINIYNLKRHLIPIEKFYLSTHLFEFNDSDISFSFDENVSEFYSDLIYRLKHNKIAREKIVSFENTFKMINSEQITLMNCLLIQFLKVS
jgi:hypothetical protein